MVEVECGGFVFTSNFESGNMARVEQVTLPPKPPPLPGQNSSTSEAHDFEFNIWTNPDCAGTEFENANRSWFYFGIRGGAPFALVKLNLVNLNRQVKMYSQGMAPVYRILPGRGLWDRIREKPTYTIEDNVFTLSFRYRTLENVKATTYFAFTFPYSYQDLMASLRGFDKRFKNCIPPEKYFPGQGLATNADDIYYHREVVCYSLDGRRLDLLTITSHHGITPYQEPRLKNLFPDLETPRPHIFVGKKVIFVSARVHPGEVPSSYVLNGLLESLLNRDDLTSVLLRRMYVFKIIPMLNPDGVARGHFRTDTRGVNLNRVYLNPSLMYHPTIYAARAIIRYAHFGREITDDVGSQNDTERRISEMPADLETQGLVPMVEDHDIVGHGIETDPPSTSDPSGCVENSNQPLANSNHTCEELIHVPVIASSLVAKKDVDDMQCEVAHRTHDVDLLVTDDINTSHGSSDLTEMDIDKEKIAKTNKDTTSSLKDSFCAGFPSTTVGCGLISEQFGVGGEEVEVCQDVEKDFLGSCEAGVIKKGGSQLFPCDENMGPEDTGKKREAKRKPLSSETSKPARMFSRPVSRNEDDSQNEESLSSSCHDSNAISSCLNSAKPSLDPSKSNLFLYMDMHGHASKKGIFMYGNHFDDLDQLVECMLLPKVMSINSQNFHFTACNFTERNMYLRDRRDGTSREGCGRVSVMKMTGLVRSYTLECNYNTGRMVNLLPPCIRDSGRMSVNPAYAVPPKYTPLVFEEVGRALGVSVLDLTSSNPCSRIPNSEFRSVNGIRDWLRSNCMSDNQLWTRMLHRPTRPQVLKKYPPCETFVPDPTFIPDLRSSIFPDYTTLITTLPSDALSSQTREKNSFDNSCFDFADYVMETLEKIVSTTSSCKSQDTLGGTEDENRWYDRKKAIQYEQELELERAKVLERYKLILSSEREKARKAAFENNVLDHSDLKGHETSKYAEFKATLEDELEAKREKVKKIRDHDRFVHEKFGKTFETKLMQRARLNNLSEAYDFKDEKPEDGFPESGPDQNGPKPERERVTSLPLKIISAFSENFPSPVDRHPNLLEKSSIEKLAQTCHLSETVGSPDVEGSSPDGSCDYTTQELSTLIHMDENGNACFEKMEAMHKPVLKSKFTNPEWKKGGERFRLVDTTKSRVSPHLEESGMRRKDFGKKDLAGSGVRRKSLLYPRRALKGKEEQEKRNCHASAIKNLKSYSMVNKDKFSCVHAHNPVTRKNALVIENAVLISLTPSLTQLSQPTMLSENAVLHYSNQTDSDIGRVMLHEMRRLKCMGESSMIWKDVLFPLFQCSNMDLKANDGSMKDNDHACGSNH